MNADQRVKAFGCKITITENGTIFAMLTFDQLAIETRSLSIEQRKKLIVLLVDSLTETPPVRTHSVMAFEGLGAQWADGTDAQA
jgi:hypothetical protein